MAGKLLFSGSTQKKGAEMAWRDDDDDDDVQQNDRYGSTAAVDAAAGLHYS